MIRLFAIGHCLLLLAACFEPSIAEGLLCGSFESCPPGQACSANGLCRVGAKSTTGTTVDASSSAELDATFGAESDATPTESDASVDAASPDAGMSCPLTQLNLLQNAAFESGPGVWVEASTGGFPMIVNDTDIASVVADSIPFLAWMGGYSLSGGASDTLHQDISVPSNGSLLGIAGVVWVDSAETPLVAFDTLLLEIVDPLSGAVLETIRTWSNLDVGTDWEAFSETISNSFAGQQVRLRWTVTFDSTNNTSFLLDSLVLSANTCDPSPPDAGVP